MEIQKQPPEFYTGTPIDADDLRYRDEFIAELWESLHSSHCLLTAPRRTGKTSVMGHLRRYPKEGFTVIYDNVQEISHPADLFVSILSRFYEKVPNLFRSIFQQGAGVIKTALDKIDGVGISEFKVSLRESDPDWHKNWRKHGEKLLQAIRAHDNRVLLIVDELPDMLLNLNAAHGETLLREFLAWFRTQRTEPLPKDDQVRWLVGGSINLSSTLDANRMVDLINDLQPMPLPVFEDREVIDFVETMLKERGVAIADSVAERFLEKLGRPIPFFMQILTQDLFRIWRKEQRELSETDVDTAFDQLVTSVAAKDRLQHYYSRIDRYYTGSKKDAAYELLVKISLSENGLSRNALLAEFERVLNENEESLPSHERKKQFNQMLLDLENDFYIEEISEGRYDFSSGLLKTWWRKYYA